MRKRREMPEYSKCTCGSKNYTTENWKDRHRIIQCQDCGRSLTAETWRELISNWNEGKV